MQYAILCELAPDGFGETSQQKNPLLFTRKVVGVEPDLQEEGEGHATKDEESMKTNEHGRREDPSGGRSDYLNGGQSVLHAYAQPPSPLLPARARQACRQSLSPSCGAVLKEKKVN